jgi:restriction system protein
LILRSKIWLVSSSSLKANSAKGIFITTSSFTKESLGYASGLAIKVVLLDGLALTNLMIDHGVGVTTESVYEVKRVDSDYFDLP